jgi:tetratricopeptide (TPR) repeat protein
MINITTSITRRKKWLMDWLKASGKQWHQSGAVQKMVLVALLAGVWLYGFGVTTEAKVYAQTTTANAAVNTIDAPLKARLPQDPSSLVIMDQLNESAMAATNEGDFARAEIYWTKLIEIAPNNAALWSNRGNAKVSQRHLEAALADYNEAVRLAPTIADPYLNRGAALQGLGRYEAAIADYDQALLYNPKDAALYNNRGNARSDLGDWAGALSDYQTAMQLEPRFTTAYGNYALALYEVGQKDQAIRTMKNILRKYPNYTDVRAGLVAALWDRKSSGEAESNWVAVENLDQRYQDLTWLREVRRFPPSLTAALERFLQLK